MHAMKQYDTVTVAAIRDDRFANKKPSFQRHPQIGDRGAIVEIYTNAFEVECCDPETGFTIWVEGMYPDEIILSATL